MGNKSAKKVQGHPDLEPGEAVVDACYGLGEGVLAAADFVTALNGLVGEDPGTG